MKIRYIAAFICASSVITGCTRSNDSAESAPPAPSKPPAESVSAEPLSPFIDITPEEGGLVAVPLDRITEKALFVNIEKAGAPTVQLLAIRDGAGKARIAFNTCQACNPSPRAFFAQTDDGNLVCQNCGNSFPPEAVGAAVRGCNPAGIPGVRQTDTAILVLSDSIDAARPAFSRWAGPRSL